MLIPGTQIKAWSSSLGIFKHHGIAGSRLLPNGMQTVVHSTSNGVVEEPINCFSANPIEIVAQPATLAEQREILQRAYGAIGRPWAITDNCEHFANWAFTGYSSSDQLQRVVGGLAFCLLCTLIAEEKPTRARRRRRR